MSEELIAGRKNLAVVGLGYVGMPLLLGFAEHIPTIGYDISPRQLAACRLEAEHINKMQPPGAGLSCASEPGALSNAHFIIVAVPTPVYEDHSPDLTPLVEASRTVGKYMPKGAIISYESTVYPGATEEVCVPVLEEASGMKCGRDFFVGYSPERINPGDTVHVLSNIVKIVSGIDEETLDTMEAVYSLVCKGGVYRAQSIKVAEAAKVAENTQRDVNIAFVNELAMMFHPMGIDTLDVLQAMDTKWNALKFRPGMVGGHCIGVDPFYLIKKAEEVGYDPRLMRAARSTNDAVGAYIARETVKLLGRVNKPLGEARVLVLGFSFKEDSDDVRNSKVDDLLRELEAFGVHPKLADHMVNPDHLKHEYGRDLVDMDAVHDADCVIVAVAHRLYRSFDIARWEAFFGANTQRVLIDVKGIISDDTIRTLNALTWRL